MKHTLVLLALAGVAAADTAPLGALRSSSPVVTNETDAAFLAWQTNSTAIMLGAGASNRAGGGDITFDALDIAIGLGAETCEGVTIGSGATGSVYSATVGIDSYAGPFGASVGHRARSSNNSVAIGQRAEAAAYNTVQIGSGRNEESGTVQIFDWPILDAEGLIPAERLGTAPIRARLYAGAGCRADHRVALYWCTNVVWSVGGYFPVSADLPSGTDAMRWDLWITAGVTGFRPWDMSGITWIGPNGPPDGSAVSPGSTLMCRCTAARVAGTNVVVLAEWLGTVAIGSSSGEARPSPTRMPGRVRVSAPGSTTIVADGGADVYVVNVNYSTSITIVPSLPDLSDGVEFEVLVHNLRGYAATLSLSGPVVFIGEAPSIPADGQCLLRVRVIRDGLSVLGFATVEGISEASRGSKGPDEPAAESGDEDEPEDEPEEIVR